MVSQLQGQLLVQNQKFGIVVGRFNEFITSRLLNGAIDTLKRHGAGDDQITVMWVPGSFEVPLAARKMAESGKFDAVLCLSAVIRGQTSHYDYVCQQITRGVGEVSMLTGVPAIFGVITCDTIEEAIDRAGAKGGNIGSNAALTAIETVNVFDQFNQL